MRGAPGGISLDRLRSFLSVVDAGGFAKSAPGDPSRQSQLSRQVRDVERALGVSLLRREGRSVAPTTAGLRLATVVRDLADGLREVGTLPDEAPTEVTLASGDSVLRWLVIPSLGSALGPPPRALVSLVASSNVLDDVMSGRAHLGVLRAQAIPAGITTSACGTLGYSLFVPRGLARAGDDLRALLLRVPLADVSGDREPLDRLAAALRLPLVASLTCETFPQAAGAVASGHFAALLPAVAATELPGAVATSFAVPALRLRSSRLTLLARTRTLETRPAAARLFAALGAALRQRLHGP